MKKIIKAALGILWVFTGLFLGSLYGTKSIPYGFPSVITITLSITGMLSGLGLVLGWFDNEPL